jgi:hypothetical protein
MWDWLVLIAHLIVTTIRTVTPGGARAVIAESLLLKHQLLILNRTRKKAPTLHALDPQSFAMSNSGQELAVSTLGNALGTRHGLFAV